MILTLQTAIFLVYLTVHATSTVNVTFFGGKNFKLPKCEVVLSGCKPICANLVGKVISIKPSVKNTCMKLYTTADCSGAPPSYRGSINDLDGDGITDLIGTPAKEWKAIGDCKQSTGVKYFFLLAFLNVVNLISLFLFKELRVKKGEIKVD